jgi:hypothetical protein
MRKEASVCMELDSKIWVMSNLEKEESNSPHNG